MGNGALCVDWLLRLRLSRQNGWPNEEGRNQRTERLSLAPVRSYSSALQVLDDSLKQDVARAVICPGWGPLAFHLP